MKAMEPAGSPPVAAEEPASPLLALLEEALRDNDAGLPAHLWERALLAPAREFLCRPGKRFRARLVEACWAVAGGRAEDAPQELPLVIELLHAGSLIVDDIEDGSPSRRGAPALHHVYGLPLALNTGNWLYFWPLTLIDRAADRIGLGAARRAELHRRARLALLRCHQGQALDLALKVTELAQHEVPRVVKATTQLKTGALMELAAALGGIAGGADGARVEAVTRFGRELGAGLQMLDDLGGITARARWDKGCEDLRLGRPTWPWAWAAVASSAAAFGALQGRARALVVADHARAADDGAADDGAAEDLAGVLVRLVGVTGRARVQSSLRLALAVLEDALGPSPALDAISAEIRRLEASYG